MKKIIFSLALLFLVGTTFAQDIVYVDTEYVLSKLPEYDEAKKKLQESTAQWQKEIAEQEQKMIDLKVTFKQNELLMSDKIRLSEKKKITQLEKQLRELKSKRFGANGDLVQQQQNLIQPIQDKIYNAIKKMAEQRDYDYVLDKSTGVSILFAKPKFDKSEEVLRIINRMN